MSAAAVDVLIPVHNGGRYLQGSLESIQNQTLADICIRVVDDGSTDGSSELLAAMAADDPRIQVHTQRNGGIVEALNAGLALCRAEFVARHDADDIAYPTRLADQVTFLRRHPRVVAMAGRARHIDPDGEPLGTLARFLDPARADPAHAPALEPYLLHPFLMLRREAIERAGGYRHVVHAEDADLYWRLRDLGELCNRPDVQGEYRMHPDSISSRSIRNGRVMSVSSQLCAISATRRVAGVPDLAFTRESGEALKAAAGSMEEACRTADAQLTAQERRRLRFAAGVKLLELADYRPYEVEASDCAFLRQALREAPELSGSNRRTVAQSYAGTAARLAAAKRWGDARALLTSRLLPAFLLRLLLRYLLPAPAHRAAQKIKRSLTFLLKEASQRRGVAPDAGQAWIGGSGPRR